jgi:hypothetical protein
MKSENMQIAGNTCRVCEQPIVPSSEGQFCPHCSALAHLACEARETCTFFGNVFKKFVPSPADPLSEAVIPSALRPPRSGGPVLAVGLVLIIAFVVVLFLIITNGHAF